MKNNNLCLLLSITIFSTAVYCQSAGNDTIICKGENAQLHATEFDYGHWKPSIYLSDTTIPNPQVIGLDTTSSFVIQTSYPNVIENGDFERNISKDVIILDCRSPQDFSKGFVKGATSQSNYTTQTVYDSSGIYEVRLLVTDNNGCTDSTSQFVRVKPNVNLYIPNSFSPNADGKNDTFEVYGIGLSQFKIQVFNRWGQEIYENKNIGWDGTFNSKKCEQGIYTYKIIIKDFMQKSHFYYGEVSLLR